MRIKKKYLLVIILVIISVPLLQIVLLSSYNAVGGSFGFRPISHNCVGFKINQETADKFFPKGDVEFQFLFHFRYLNPPDSENLNDVFCFGQDIWFGE